jgi:hypothetical protein
MQLLVIPKHITFPNNVNAYSIHEVTHHISVGIITRLWAGCPRIRDLIPGRCEMSYLQKCTEACDHAHEAVCSVRTAGCHGDKSAGQ